MLGLIGAIIIGLIAGLLARLIMPGRARGGIIITILLGIGGALVATWLGRLVHIYHHDQKAGLIGAVIGALIILAVYGALTRDRRRV